jgi:antitoxin component YwqK of YwqJK toxin-antitoxin module
MPKSYNKMCGIYKEYYSNGKLNFEQTYGTTPNTYGKLYGPFKNYNTRGILISEGIYEDGLISGYFNEYYDSGAIRLETYYRNGKISGPMTTYYENGNIHIKSTHTYEDDFSREYNRDGKYEEYARNIVNRGAKTYIKDLEDALLELALYEDNESYVTEAGDVEKWAGKGIDKTKITKEIQEHIQELKDQLDT